MGKLPNGLASNFLTLCGAKIQTFKLSFRFFMGKNILQVLEIFLEMGMIKSSLNKNQCLHATLPAIGGYGFKCKGRVKFHYYRGLNPPGPLMPTYQIKCKQQHSCRKFLTYKTIFHIQDNFTSKTIRKNTGSLNFGATKY